MTTNARALSLLPLLAVFAFLFPASQATATGPTCFGKAATLVGTFGNDVLRGTGGSDVIVALSGKDTILADGGSDYICGGTGQDTIVGGDGNDMIAGEADADMLYGGAGSDQIWGDTPGSSVISGSDVLYEGGGGGSLFAGPGVDLVFGGTAQSALHGGDGSDLLSAGLSTSTIDGGAGTDRCLGGSQRACEVRLSSLPVCPPEPNASAGVYWPKRLLLKIHCSTIHGTVKGVGVAPDGDLGINLIRSDPGHVGQTVHVEFMPRDVTHLARPQHGDVLALTGEYVFDTNHSHYEVHPVFREVIKRKIDGIAVGPATSTPHVYTSGVPSGGNPFGSNAICIRAGGSLCENWAGTLMAG